MKPKKIVVKKKIKKLAEDFDVQRADASDEGYCDLMANVEGAVQKVLEEEKK